MILTSFDTIQKYNQTALTYEPPHAKTNKMTCAPSKDADQPDHPPVWSESSLSVWRNVGHLTTYWVHSVDSDQTGRTRAAAHIVAG